MATVTRSGRKLKDEDSNSSRKHNGNKASITPSSTSIDNSSLRRSTRETSLKKSTPSNSRKSVRLKKRVQLPEVKRKSERVEKQKLPSPVRKSDRVERNRSSTSAGSSKPPKDLNSVDEKTKNSKKDKSKKQVEVEFGVKSKNKKRDRRALNLTSKQNRLDSRGYRASFGSEETEVQESGHSKKLCDAISDSGCDADSKEIEGDQDNCSVRKEEFAKSMQAGEGCGRSIEDSSSGSKKNSGGTLGKSGMKHKNDFEKAYESSNGDSSRVSNCSGSSLHSHHGGVTPEETVKVAEAVELYSSTEEDLQKPEMMKRPDISSDPDISATETCEETSNSTANAVPTSPRGSKRSDSLDRCTSCSKKQRVDLASKKCKACSCEHMKYTNLCAISTFKESYRQVPDSRDSHSGEVPVNLDASKADSGCIDAQRGDCAGKLVTGAQRNFIIDGTQCHTIIDHLAPFEADEGEVQAPRSTEEHCSNMQMQLKESPLKIQTDSTHYACGICNLDGNLLKTCDGNGCKRSYHFYCLDPPLEDFPGGWHCAWCVKKKIELGFHTVSGGVESIWDVREMEAPNSEGMQKQKKYLVKYQGLAHIHNCWMPEDQLCLEAPSLLTNFIKNQNVIRWKSEWTKPIRLLKRRLLMSLKQHDDDLVSRCDDNLDCKYEWLVKWSGLGYEHVTWELETASFLRSPEALILIKEYEDRLENARIASHPFRVNEERKCSFSKLLEFPGRGLSGLSNDYLSFVNKLRECWHKYRNAVVIEEQEQILKMVLFILSLQPHICRPFLIISTSSGISAWEADFSRLAPSVNVVVYNGDKSVREYIRKLEFYEEGGCILFQVLLVPLDAVIEDLEALECIGWEIIIVDEAQNSRISIQLERLNLLTTELRMLLVTGPIKDIIIDYINLLSFIDSKGDGKSDDNMKMSFASNISLVKERFNGFVVSEGKSDTFKFVEYWVPVCLSNVQLEQYCATLLSNSISLRSCSKNDPVGALRNILISARKTCDHPYLVDQSLQSLLTEGLPPVEFLDVGVNASGKLQLLDKILSEIRKRDMRALILFQPIRGDGRNPIGDILDDFLRQRFGKDSYERVDSGLALSKKQVAMNMFNKKERGRFVFLIENRACLSSIKLSSVDIVILFDSDWNPLNDIKALQKISISSQFEELKVFRLFSSFTVEENVLILAKQNVTLDSNLENINCNTSHLLLTWGASYLFKRLDEFHGSYTSSSGSHLALNQSSVDSVLHELLNELPSSENRNMKKCSIILKVFQGGSSYSGDVKLPGEMEMHSRNEELPHVFWTSLLEGRSPKWRYSSGPSPRVRRKVQYFDDVAKKSKGDSDEVSRKRKKVMTNASEPMSPKSGLNDKKNDKKKVVSIEREVTSPSPTAIESQDLSKPTINSKCVNHSMSDVSEMPAVHMVESEEKRNLRHLQKNLHMSLKPEILKLCNILQLPGVVKDMAGRFLEYIMNNNHVNREPVTIFQAFQISVCWCAASLLKHKIIRRDSLALAKQHLNFECKEEEAYLICTKMRMLKKTFANEVNKAIDPDVIHDPTRSKVDKSHSHVQVSQSNLSEELELEEGEIRESDREPNSPNQTVSRKKEQSSESDKATVSSINDFTVGITQVKKIYRKRLRRLDHKQMEEYEELKKVREKAMAELEKKQKLESALIRTIHSSQASVRLDKLRMVAQEFSRKMDKLNNHMETQEKSLKAMHLAARNEEELLMGHWLKEAKSGRPVDAFAVIPLSNSGFRMELLEDGNHIQVDAHQTSTRKSDPSSESRDPDSIVPIEAIPVDPPVVRGYILEAGVCSELSTVAIESAGGNDETDTTTTMAMVEAEQADVHNELLTDAMEAAGGNDETDTTATMATVEADQADVHNELPTVATGSGGESDKIVATATMVPVEAEQVSICNEQPTLATESYRGNDEIDNMVEENENVVAAQPCDRIGASDCCNSSLSMNQIQMASPLAHNDVTSAQDGEIASPQEPIMGNLQPSGSSSGLATEVVTSNNKKHLSQLVEDPPVQPSDAVPSGQCNMGSLVPSSGLELPLPLPLHTSSLDRQPELLACTPAQSEINQSNGGDASIQQVEVIMATQSLEEQNEQLNGCHLQPDIPLPSTVLSSLQIEVPTQLPAILQNAPVDHSLLQPVLQLQRPAHVNTALGGNGANISHSSRSTDFLADSILRHPLAAPVASRMPQILHPDPLQNELDRISKEIKHVKEMHDEVKSRLTASCEKEIEEIRKKYNALIEDAENAHAEKKNLLEANYNKVDMNRRLARAFRIKCSDSKGMGAALALQQGAHQGLMRPRYQNPLWQQTQRVPVPAPSTSALPSQPPVQVVQHSSALFSSNSIRSHVSPTVACPPIGNRHVGSELRAPAPHLQPFRPSSSITAISLSPLTNTVPQQSLSNSVNCSILQRPVPLHPVIPSSGTFNRMLPQPESGVTVSNFHNCHQSAVELPTNINNTCGKLPNILPSFQGLTSDTVANMSQMAVAGGGLRSTTASAGSTSDVVCLSDDDDE